MGYALHLGPPYTAPWEYVELRLVQLYHCTHEQLDDMDARRCLLDLEMAALAEQARQLHS